MIIKFNNSDIYISTSSFKQNNKIAKELRLDVKLELDEDNIVTIGGESYIFGLTNKNIYKIINYTNSISIYNDVILNNNIYNKKLQNYLIDYNKFKNIKNGNILILNLAKLNINLLNIINTRFYKKIIIINCHHNEFWKRIKLLNNYILIKRKQYITDYNFITINILKYKSKIPIFIPLGNNCSIAYQLNNLNIRYNSYPFDWTKSNIKKINQILANDFKEFEKINKFKFSPNHLDNKFNKNGTYLLKNIYNIHFAHELLNINNIDIIQNKLKKRIKKFKNCKNNYIIFIILNLEKNIDDEINKLILNLLKYFTNFKILYISNYILKDNKYIIPYYIDNEWSDWKFEHLNWNNIIFNSNI